MPTMNACCSRSVRWMAAVLISTCAVMASSTIRADEAVPHKFTTKADIEYGEAGGEKLLLDIAVPEGDGPFPCIMVIHGGGWATGNKNMHRDLIKELAAQGYVAATVGYRLAPKHPFPAQVEDVKCAVRYLRAHAKDWKIQPDKIGAVGFSAGAHLSMMLGVMDKEDGLEGDGGWPDESSKVQTVVAFFGPTNLLSELPKATEGILANFLGGKADEKKDAYRKASPITYVNRGDAEMLLFQGTKDGLVPGDQAWQMAEALAKAGVKGRIEILVGADHGWGNPELDRTKRATLEFFDERLKK